MRRKNNKNINIGHILKSARISAGYTQEEAAEKVNCSNRYLGQLETDRTLGSISLIIDLCNLYKISLNDIYSEYLSTNFDYNVSSVKGYQTLSAEYRSIVDNTIQFLNKLQSQ